jgi:predicted PurR-regulated permease PerM
MADNVLSGYIRGQLLVAAILSLLYGIGLAVVGLRFGFAIGFLAGWLSVIPYVGFSFGFLTSMMIGIANYQGVGQLMGVVAVFLVVQGLEGTVITPKLVGNKVGLSALATMLSLIIGGNLFGLVGMLIAIPVAGTLKIVLVDIKDEYTKLDFYNKDHLPE